MKNNEGYSRQDNYPEETTRSLSAHYREILSLLGEDAEREGLDTDGMFRTFFSTHGQ